jgi:hypothetical protein
MAVVSRRVFSFFGVHPHLLQSSGGGTRIPPNRKPVGGRLIRRFSLHILPPGLVRIRHYGILGIAGSLCASLLPGAGITKFLENDGTLKAAQRSAGHADSRTTKLYDRRGQKVFEDMERIRY